MEGMMIGGGKCRKHGVSAGSGTRMRRYLIIVALVLQYDSNICNNVGKEKKTFANIAQEFGHHIDVASLDHKHFLNQFMISRTKY